MSREETNELKYTIALIAEFAGRFGLDEKQAFNYMKRFQGMDYVSSFYDVLHTLSFDDSIEAVAAVCRQHGGKLNYQAV